MYVCGSLCKIGVAKVGTASRVFIFGLQAKIWAPQSTLRGWVASVTFQHEQFADGLAKGKGEGGESRKVRRKRGGRCFVVEIWQTSFVLQTRVNNVAHEDSVRAWRPIFCDNKIRKMSDF